MVETVVMVVIDLVVVVQGILIILQLAALL
jgi:hypothetical protein